MTKSELINSLAQQMPEFSKDQIELCMHAMFEGIVSALEKGGRVELRGFGSFAVKSRAPRVGCDPRTGKAIRVEERHIPYFRAGKQLLEQLN